MNTFVRTILDLVGAATVFALAGCATLNANEPVTAVDSMIRVQSVEVIASPGGPVVVLNVPGKSIPVFVDSMVALSIQVALSGEGPPRPLSHDLMHTVLDSLDAKVTQIGITLRNGTYHAALTVTAMGKRQVFDSRASDAIAMALRARAPILLDPAVVDAAGPSPAPRRSSDPI